MRSVTPIALGYNSLYLVEDHGERVLVDAGPDFETAWETLSEAVGARRPDEVAITHAHLDHAGLGAQWLRAGVPVALGAADVHLAEAPSLANGAEWDVMTGFVRGSGAPSEVASAAIEGLHQRREWARHAATDARYRPAGRDSRWPTGLRYEPFHGVEGLEDGRYAGAGLRVVECPGHTPGNVVLVHETEGWLFSGDQLLPLITPTPAIQVHIAGEQPARFRSLPAFAASLRRLQAMQFERCYPGHGEPFENVRGVIDANLSQIEQRGERVMELVRARPRSAYEVADALYPRALARRFWQIIATVQGQLDILEDTGRVGRDGANWSPAG